jgi:hypothetical protein
MLINSQIYMDWALRKRFISEHSDTHFRFHENPFSWHEYTGDKPEAPPFASEKTLDSFIEKYSSRIYMEQYY